MASQTISSLKPKCQTHTLEARVIRKWKTYKRPEVHLLLLDEHGDAIEAMSDAQTGPHYDLFIRHRACYSITGFVCVEARTTGKLVNKDTMIVFGNSATFTPVDNDKIEAYYFDFAPYSALKQRLLEKNKQLTGRFISAKLKPNKTGKKLLCVKLQHESGKIIEVALWEEIATAFNQRACEQDTEPVVVAMTSLKVSYYNELQLGSTSATETFVNPCISELFALIERFKHLPTTDAPSAPDTYEADMSDLTPLSGVLNELPNNKKEATYKCLARITHIECGNDKSWCYETCLKCGSKLFKCGEGFSCIKCVDAHGNVDDFSYKYRFVATITDDTTSATAVFFDNIANSLIGTNCYNLKTAQPDSNPLILPNEIESLKGKTYIFELEAKNDGYGQTLNVNKVYEPPKEVAAATSSPTKTNTCTSSAAIPSTPSAKTPKRKYQEAADPRQKLKAKEQ